MQSSHVLHRGYTPCHAQDGACSSNQHKKCGYSGLPLVRIYCCTAKSRNGLKEVVTVWHKTGYLQKNILFLIERVATPIPWAQNFALDLPASMMKSMSLLQE